MEEKEKIERLYHYMPPKIVQELFKKDPKLYYKAAEAFLGVKFKHQSQKWKSKAYPTYEDFIQAIITGFNPYKESKGSKDKGIIQAIQEYNPYKQGTILKERVEEQGNITIKTEFQNFETVCLKMSTEVCIGDKFKIFRETEEVGNLIIVSIDKAQDFNAGQIRDQIKGKIDFASNSIKEGDWITSFLWQIIDDIEQAICPYCHQRGEIISLWPNVSGNTLPEDLAPRSRHSGNNKYCGKLIRELTPDQVKNHKNDISEIIQMDGKHFEVCNFINRLSSVKKHIDRLAYYFVQDIRKEEYSKRRSMVQHPFYECSRCHSLTPDFSLSHQRKGIKCDSCGTEIDIELANKSSKRPLWKSRAGAQLSLNDTKEGEEGSPPLSEIVAGYDPSMLIGLDPAVFVNNLVEKDEFLQKKLVDQVRYVCASKLSKKKYKELMNDPNIKKVNGVPETSNFQIFHEYYYLRTAAENNGEGKSMTYRVLAKKFLKKEQHYSRCLKCNNRMNEPTEKAKFEKVGIKESCDSCGSVKLKYHGPKCGQELTGEDRKKFKYPEKHDPNCKEHGDLTIVMYIFQTIEPKIRRVEKFIKPDKACYELYKQILENKKIIEEMDSYRDMAKNLNF